jgi:hypothetical protein
MSEEPYVLGYDRVEVPAPRPDMTNPAQIAAELDALAAKIATPEAKAGLWFSQQLVIEARLGREVLRNLPTIIAALKAMEEQTDGPL